VLRVEAGVWLIDDQLSGMAETVQRVQVLVSKRGRSMAKGPLYKLFRNWAYLGERAPPCLGEHEAIVTREL
jgi:hypothetical protein